MSKTLLASVALVGALSWSVPAQAQDAVAAASQAMGVATLKTVEYSATGYDFAMGQSGAPGAPWPKFVNKSYTRVVNFETPASKVDRVRTQGEFPAYGGGQQPIMGDQNQSQTVIVGAGTPWVQQLELHMLPHGFLRAAAARNATSERRGATTVVSFKGDNGAMVTGFINAQNQVERVETLIDHPVMGDTPFEAIYRDYKTVDGVQFPMHILQRQGGFPTFDLTVSQVKVNAPVTIEPPQAAAGQGGGQPAAQGTPSEQLAPGVFLFPGGYAVMALDMGDHILFIEPGNSEARALAVIAEAKKLIPGKPVRYVVNTHHHFDHSSGLRAFVAEGATILTHEWNQAYLRDLLSRPHTLNPDAQEKAKKPLSIQAVGDKHVISGNGHTVELHRMTDFGHTPGMLMAYFPQHRLLYEADGYNALPANAPVPATPSPFHQSLLANVARLNLAVDRLIPVHYPADGRVITLADVRRMVGAGSN